MSGSNKMSDPCMAALYSMRLLRCAAHTTRLAPRNDKLGRLNTCKHTLCLFADEWNGGLFAIYRSKKTENPKDNNGSSG